jgi:predicted Fe-Mo cluster-binding NifX family protein
MKVAISATGVSLDAEVDPRFGRCSYFVIIDPDTMEFEAIDNTGVRASEGAGITAAQLLSNKDVRAVLTGNCGPNAFQVLSTAGIEVITGVSGVLRDAVAAYKSGGLKAISQPNVTGHFGMGGGKGTGLGR